MQVQERAVPAIDYPTLRRTAVDCQIRPYGVIDQRLLGRFLDVPREIFTPEGQESLAYSDGDVRLPLEGGGARAMLAPMVLARLLQDAAIRPTDVVLDVGGATGYTAALAAGLGASVVALESDAFLSRRAAENFRTLALENVEAVNGSLREGASAKAPYDVIVVNGAAEEGLDELLGQLAQNGRLLAFAPQTAGAAKALLYSRDRDAVSSRTLFEASAKLLPEFAKTPAFAF